MDVGAGTGRMAAWLSKWNFEAGADIYTDVTSYHLTYLYNYIVW